MKFATREDEGRRRRISYAPFLEKDTLYLWVVTITIQIQPEFNHLDTKTNVANYRLTTTGKNDEDNKHDKDDNKHDKDGNKHNKDDNKYDKDNEYIKENKYDRDDKV
ncbi:15941_t:CDS:2 [Dentiscutata erythropus]|uniref:15941_t:CDS:1 n=1 Tax=Dentiscutata erythropus TaxID=1348616 RepID=A0A9N9FNM4_9GLOM|nr:15941_t:CDS:2 [Dentiscutata erythropus]